MQKEELKIKWGIGAENEAAKKVAYTNFGIDLPPLPSISHGEWQQSEFNGHLGSREMARYTSKVRNRNEIGIFETFAENRYTSTVPREPEFNIEEIETRLTARLHALKLGDKVFPPKTGGSGQAEIPSSPIMYRPI